MTGDNEEIGTDSGAEPDTEELEEPSTEKSVEEEPEAKTPEESEPSHEAVGIGVVGRPLVEPEGPPDEG
ncbi:hypothetical protein LG299_03905 [Microbacterium lacus]|uniref:hypothetical protein n=1 Tax=Microbacterium lacus TaxID=415217 RepID=UPI00384EA8AE